MATKAGVWIDHRQAIVVLITEAGQEIKKIAFDIGQPVRTTGHARSKNDFVAENRVEQKTENDRKSYFDDVLASVSEASTILILGPGEAKGEFRKHIEGKKLQGVTLEVETADKMTDGQIVAKVSEHFSGKKAK